MSSFSCRFFFLTLSLSGFWTSRGHKCCPFTSPVLAFHFYCHRVQQSHCSSIFHRVLLTHALTLSASQFVHKKKSPRIYTSIHSGGFELPKLTYTRLEDSLIRHWGDRLSYPLLSLEWPHQRTKDKALALSSMSEKVGTRCRSPSYERFLEGCSSSFLRLAEHLTVLRAWCKQHLPGW